MARSRPAKAQEESAGRRFLLEFVSVALGVLLALVVEQAADEWRERQRVRDLRSSMDEEIADFSEIFRLRQRSAPCVTRKLDALDAFLRGGGPPAPLVNVGRPSFFFSSRGGWNSDASDQLSRHLGADTFKRYGEIYQGMEQYSALSAQEQDAWVTLQTLEGDPDSVGPERRARLREAIAQARNDALLLGAISGQMLDEARTVGVRPNGSLAGIKVESAPLCKALATAGTTKE